MKEKENYSECNWSYGWIEDGISFMSYKPKVKTVTLEIAKSTVANRIIVSGHTKLPNLLTTYGNIKFEKQAKKYIETEIAHKYVSAVAILVTSPITKFNANLIMNKYMPFKRTKVPFKLFLVSERNRALNWLSNYKLEKLN